MKRLLRGSVILAVAVGFLSCSGDPTDSFREPSGIVATPTALFIDIGETKPVTASLTDEQGNQIAADYEISAVGSGISVVQDTTFLNTNVPGQAIDNAVRFQVTGSAIANSSFTLTAGGESVVVPVRVTPSTVSIGISNPTPALGDTIVLTALAGVLFTDSSEVTFAGGPPGDIVGVSADQTQLTVVPGPNTLGSVTVAHTTVSYDQTLDFTVTSEADETVTSPALTNLDGAVLSNPTPALGEVVTLTLPIHPSGVPIRVLPDSFPFLPDSSPGVLADSGLLVEGATNPRAVTVSADSSVITFIPAPNSDSFVTVKGVVPSTLPQFSQILSTTIKLVTPVVDSLPATVSSTAPAVNVPVVLTSTNPQFTFVAPGAVTVGGAPAIVTGQTASTLTFLPNPGSTGNVAVGAVDVVGFGLPLPSTAPTVTTSSTVPSAAGTDTPGTAPAFPVPAVGSSTGLYDSGPFGFTAPIGGPGFPSRLYRLVVPAGIRIQVTLDWTGAEDLGVYWLNAAGTAPAPGLAPADGPTAATRPETATNTFAAGTYLMAVVNFSATTPGFITIRLDGSAVTP